MHFSPRLNLPLDGIWGLSLDPSDRGKTQGWQSGQGLPDAIEVAVPTVWDPKVPDYDGAGWYVRSFTLGPEWAGRHAVLQFDAADYFAEVWLNGTFVGAHEGGYTPFQLNATEAIRSGENTVSVRLVNPRGPNGFGDFKPGQIPCAEENGNRRSGGLCGAVRLVGMHPIHVADVFVMADIRRKRVNAHVSTSSPATVRVTIDGTELSFEGSSGKVGIDFPNHELWSPDSPKLYTVRCDVLNGGEIVDSTSVRFGMREFTVRENRFCLNNRIIPIKGVLHQLDFPAGLATHDTADMAKKELERVKESGFNLVRLQLKIVPQATLDLADELGLLIYAEPPIGRIENSEWLRDRCEREVREMILRDRNHPSIVIWGMLNKSGNAGRDSNDGAQLIKDNLCRLARSLDPSRLIIDDSGGANSTRESSRFIRPYKTDFEAYDDFHIYQRGPVDYEIKQYYQHGGDPNRLGFVSEFGFGGLEDFPNVLEQYGEKRKSLKEALAIQTMLDAALPGFIERGLDREFGDFSGFAAAAQEVQSDAARHHIEAIRANAKRAGYCYTQLCDGDTEFCAGVLDRWRKPKPVFRALKAMQNPLLPIIHITKTNLVSRESTPVNVSLANDNRVEMQADLSLQVVGPTNQVLWKKRRAQAITKGLKDIWSGSIAASGSAGLHRFVIRLIQGGKVVAQNEIELNVLEPTPASDVAIHLVDPNREWRDACFRLAKAGPARSPIHVIPPLSNTIRAYPESEIQNVLLEVKGGAVALVFGPPNDWNDLADHIDPALRATGRDAVGSSLGAYHYVKMHPIFEGLPSRTLMRQIYANIVPPKTFLETGDEDICGTFDASCVASGGMRKECSDPWGSDILVRRYGSGRIVFTHMRVLENLGKDPVADRIFVNMLNHFVRRSVPAEETPAPATNVLDWLRRERNDRIRQWMVIGMFPNWGDEGHNTAYPPETSHDFAATYPGWYKPISWKRWQARADDNYMIDLQEAFTPVYDNNPRFDYGVGYAYAEFTAPTRTPALVSLALQDAAKLWINGALIHDSQEHLPVGKMKRHEISAYIRQGRNTILVKISKVPGEFRFGFDITPSSREPIPLKWWR